MKTIPLSATVDLEANSPRIIALSLLVVLLLFALTGCKNETRAPADVNTAGVYTLVSVDGQNVPCNLNHEGTSMAVKSGFFTISTNGSCRSLITFSVPQRGDINREPNATYTRRDAELTMQWEGAGKTVGYLNGNQFTMTNEGMVFCYQK